MFKIGEFSRLSRVPVKTLRFYDEIALLKPIEVDPFTGYRKYSASQLPRLNRILYLKELGLRLEQIQALLENEPGFTEIKRLLQQRKEQLVSEIQNIKDMLCRIEICLKQLEQEGRMAEYEVKLKKSPTILAATRRGNVPTYWSQEILWRELEGHLHLQAIKPSGPCFTVYYDDEYKEADVDLEVCEPVKVRGEDTSRISFREVPGHDQVASVIHRGSFQTLRQAYLALLAWVEENGYHVCGPNRDIYLETGAGITRQDDPSYVTEIQVPVKKVKT